MNQQQQDMSQGQSRQSGSWSGLASSLMKVATATTVFGIQQIQNSFALLTDSRRALHDFRQSLDSVSDAMLGHVEPSMQDTADRVNRTGDSVIDATVRATEGSNGNSQSRAGNGTAAEEVDPDVAYSGRKR